MKFPEKHYVGFQKRDGQNLLGFMTHSTVYHLNHQQEPKHDR